MMLETRLLLQMILAAALLHIGVPLQYEPSRLYNYHYGTSFSFNEPDVAVTSQAKKDVGFKFTADVTLTPIWNSKTKMLVKLTVSNADVASVAWLSMKQDAKTLARWPFYLTWEGQHLTQVYISAHETDWAANIKLGLASLFQIDGETGERRERDVSGHCMVKYNIDGDVITKTKTSCTSEYIGHPNHSNINPVLGVSLTSQNEARYVIQDDIIQSVVCSETHVSRVVLHDNLAAAVVSSQSLELQSSSAGASHIQASSLQEAVQVENARYKLNLKSNDLTPDVTKVTPKPGQLPKVLKKKRNLLVSKLVSTPDAAEAYLELVASWRQADKAAIRKILSNAANRDIMPSLVDVAVAAQTAASQEVLMEVLDFKATKSIELAERYLLGAAFSTHPPQTLIADLLRLYEQDVSDHRLRDSIGDALGAVVYTYSRHTGHDDKLVTSVGDAVLKKLASCDAAACTCMQMRLLANAALPPTLPHLLKVAESAPQAAISESALKALRRFEPQLLQGEAEAVLSRIYHQQVRMYDSAVRTSALKLLLTVPSQDMVRDVLASTAEPGQHELAMYVQARLGTAVRENDAIKDHYMQASRDTTLSNYNVLAPKGTALAFKGLLSETGSMRASYDMYVENGRSGVMKRSGMDVDILSPSQSLPMYSFGIFATGLEKMLGEEVEPGQEGVEPTAGLALNLLDVSLRPVTFFTGQSGLMSAVWNAPSSLVSALQTNVLLQDTVQTVPLSSGLVLHHAVQGAVSMDLSGLVSISLWNRNCHSLIKNSGSLVVRGSLGVQSSAFRTGVSYTARASSIIDFTTDVDFYDGIKMCLQMARPASKFSHAVRKYESLNGYKRGYNSRRRHHVGINAASYPLPKPNNEQCRALLKG